MTASSQRLHGGSALLSPCEVALPGNRPTWQYIRYIRPPLSPWYYLLLLTRTLKLKRPISGAVLLIYQYSTLFSSCQIANSITPWEHRFKAISQYFSSISAVIHFLPNSLLANAVVPLPPKGSNITSPALEPKVIK